MIVRTGTAALHPRTRPFPDQSGSAGLVQAQGGIRMARLVTLAHEAEIDPLPGDEHPQLRAPRRWLRSIASPELAVVEFCKDVSSPGLNGMPPLSTLHIRNGGQHRY
jgi:hypothetical protein